MTKHRGLKRVGHHIYISEIRERKKKTPIPANQVTVKHSTSHPWRPQGNITERLIYPQRHTPRIHRCHRLRRPPPLISSRNARANFGIEHGRITERDVPVVISPPNMVGGFTAKTGPEPPSLRPAFTSRAKHDEYEVAGGATGDVVSPICELFVAGPA